jgi:phosphoglycolate phosphatase
MNVFVTGATGFIGTHVVAQLRQAGHEVIALQGDLAVAASYPRQRFDAVIHLASLIPHREAYSPAQFADVNVRGTRQLLAHFREAHFVYVSSLDVEREQLGDYARTKLEAEQSVREHASHCIVRLPSVFGPGQRQQSKLIPRLLRAAVGGEAMPALTDEARPCLYVTDAAAAVCAGLTSRGVMTVPGNRVHNRDLARLITAAARGQAPASINEAERPLFDQLRACVDHLRRPGPGAEELPVRRPGGSRIFFDFDGPILDVSVRHHRVYADAVSELRGAPLGRDVFWEAKRHKTPEEEILRQSGLDAGAAEAFRRLKLERIEATRYLALDLLQPGIVPVLEQLASTHTLILVTLRNSRRQLEAQLEQLGLTVFFPLVLSGNESESEGWRVKCGLIQRHFPALDPVDWLIGDTETDVLAGKHLGLRTAAVTNGIRTKERLEALHPDVILPTAADFAQILPLHENPVR